MVVKILSYVDALFLGVTIVREHDRRVARRTEIPAYVRKNWRCCEVLYEVFGEFSFSLVVEYDWDTLFQFKYQISEKGS